MALLTGQQVCDEVAFRLNNRIAANSTGAGSIINSANRMLGFISSSGSFVWEQVSGALNVVAGTPNSGDSAPIAGCDSGKEIALFNQSNGTRIERARTSDTISSSTGYLNVATGVYNTFRLSVAGLNLDPVVYLYPGQGLSGLTLITAVWHVQPPTLLYATSPTVLWNNPAMDMLLIDWTEADVKRKLGMAGWDVLWADCIKRIGEFRITYSSQRENTGPETESKVATEEKQVGRD
jgi:hypothetical protein